MNILLGVLLHALGGFASGSFYLPYKKVNGWAWESYWLIGGLFSWLVAPLVLGYLTVPHLFDVLRQASTETLLWTYFWGILWGFGGLTFGLAMRYLGLSLGMAVTLGLCAVFGTLVPPIWQGMFGGLVETKAFGELLSTTSGQVIMAGLGVCVLGILVCGFAGMLKEKSLTTEQKQESIAEFDIRKGLLVAVFSGIMSACFSFGLTAGQSIAKLAAQQGTNPLFVNNAILVIILLGGLTTNAIWCIYLNFKNKTFSDYANPSAPALRNVIFCALAGVTWYFQFFFYGMGDSQMGEYRFSGWTLHMAFIITFSSLWGLFLHEWRGANAPTMRTISLGILTVVLSTVIVGYGNYLAS
ncbi:MULTISPECIES: L-rhamnose/proton symporter RhaT [Hymenobacter]|uniref:L-rhamnose/proton symporter RhaT n=1 Tax=Hymenobacter jejuensis TaxID=2502781 RepID=A0A5B7ZWV4_9BACT|nr:MULTISPECIES: L-rhamnose/proton symporter RhaT [Hymenobacter]MBC6988203.1 L-rhamnose/proton symporter RhaT [Hymenobacter sp. BT491]QDA59430.1 L-rhamnose/proton symporter RhaT [Hymenobacter jejuensis]